MSELLTINQTSIEYQGAIELHTRIITSGSIAANALVEMCKGLKEMRDRRQFVHLGYTSFETYVEQAANMKARQAYTYISTIERLGESVLQSNAGLGITKLELLAQLPESKREEVSEIASDMTTRELKDKIAELTKAKEQLTFLQAQVDEMDEVNETLVNQVSESTAAEKQLEKEVQILKDELNLARKAQPIIVEQPKVNQDEIRKEIEQQLLAKQQEELAKIKNELSNKFEDELDQAKAESFEKGKSLGFAAVQGIEAEKTAALKTASELEKKLAVAGGNSETILFAHLFTEFQEQFNKLIGSIGRMDPEFKSKYNGAMSKYIGMMIDKVGGLN
jgi:hypothetical protein